MPEHGSHCTHDGPCMTVAVQMEQPDGWETMSPELRLLAAFRVVARALLDGYCLVGEQEGIRRTDRQMADFLEAMTPEIERIALRLTLGDEAAEATWVQ